MGVRPKGRVRLLRVRLVGLSVFFLRRRHRRKKTLAQALTGQGRSSSCKIWEVGTQSPLKWTFQPSSILLPSGFRSLYGRVLAYHTRVVLGGSRRRSHEGASPLKLPIGSWVGTPCEGVAESPLAGAIPESPSLETCARKGSMEQSVHRPLFESGLFSCPSRQFRCL